jgi:hypothetical protein
MSFAVNKKDSKVYEGTSSGAGGEEAKSTYLYMCPSDCEGLVDSRNPKRDKCTSDKDGDQEAFGQKNRYSYFLVPFHCSFLSL